MVCRIRFKTEKGFTEARQAIIDTGAYITILPFSIWKRFDVKILGEHYVRGLVPKKECLINVRMGLVKAKIDDEFGNQTEEMNMRAFLTPSDVVPIIIGFKDFLEKFQVYFDPIKGTGYVE